MAVPRALTEVKPRIDRALRPARAVSLAILGLALFLSVSFALLAVKIGSSIAGVKTFLAVGFVTGLPGALFWRSNLRDLTRLFRQGTFAPGVVESLTYRFGRSGTKREGPHPAQAGVALYANVSYAVPSSGALGIITVLVPSHENLKEAVDVLVLVDAGAPDVAVVAGPGEPDGSWGLYCGNPKKL